MASATTPRALTLTWASGSRQQCKKSGLVAAGGFHYKGLVMVWQKIAKGCWLVAEELPLLVAASFSKNFGLHNERIGALMPIDTDGDAATQPLAM